MKTLMGGKKLNKPILPEIEMYELCVLLNQPPSVIKAESYDDMAALLLVHNAKTYYESEAGKKAERKQGRKDVANKHR
ncbi:hypothetical protein CN624_21130 [Bacillus toyonensis]|nr:hypothetical protein CN624_21130 [Bacillus toyonensis]